MTTTAQDDVGVEMNKLNGNDEQEIKMSTDIKYENIKVETREYEYYGSNKVAWETYKKNPIRVLEHIATGTGPTEMEAKVDAAYQMLQKHFKRSEQNDTLFAKTQEDMGIETNSLKSKQDKQELEMLHNKPTDEEYNCATNENRNPTIVELLHEKSPVFLLEKWSRHQKPPTKITYTFVVDKKEGYNTYACNAYDITVLGKGVTKKIAKRNAAAEMWTKLFDIDSTINRFIHLLNSNETYCLNSDNSYLSIIQRICNSYKWIGVLKYNFQELILMYDQTVVHNKIHKVTCQLFHLQTIGTHINQKMAKYKAARLMVNEINRIGADKLNKLYTLHLKIKLPDEECQENKTHILCETIKKLSSEWNLPEIFQSYIRNMNNIKKSESTETGRIQELRKEENEMVPEIFNTSNVDSIGQLHFICHKLGFNISKTHTKNTKGRRKRNRKHDNDCQYLYTMELHVHVLPKIVTFGSGMFVKNAYQVAASNAILIMKTLSLMAKK